MDFKKIYAKKLQDPRWQRKRLEIFNRDKFCCLICSSNTDMLQVHHERYCKNPWESPNEDLKTLCFRCHDIVEICKKENINYTNVNRLSYPDEVYVYMVNFVLEDGRLAVVIINNVSGEFVYDGCTYSKDFVEILLNTF